MLLGSGKHGSARRNVKRKEHSPRDIPRNDQDDSSSHSTLPANSVEAFPEPRGAHRADASNSHLESSLQFRRNRAGLFRNPIRFLTLNTICVPSLLTYRTNDVLVNFNFLMDEVPGKPYQIIFEVLEEFLALCTQGIFSLSTASRRDIGAIAANKASGDMTRSASASPTPSLE